MRHLNRPSDRARAIPRGALTPAALAVGLLAAMPAGAAEGWTFAVSPYAWLPGMSTSAEIAGRTLNADVSAGDTISNLDFAFMGVAEARNGRWGLILDMIYTDLGTSKNTPFGELWSKANVDTKLTTTTVYAGYRVVEAAKGSVDILGGARFYDLKIDTTLEPGRRDRVERSLGDDWADPVVGLRGRYAFNENWYATGLADAGGFDGGDQSWQLFGSLGYQFNARWSMQGGWRYLDIDRDIGGDDVSVSLSGPVVGFTYRF